jgi:hypothetical protein
LAEVESAAGFFDASVAQTLPDFQCGGEALDSQFALAEAQVGHAAEVQAVGLPPGILAMRMFGAVERVAGILEGLAGVAGSEVGFGKG